jgi:hypothetical protein
LQKLVGVGSRTSFPSLLVVNLYILFMRLNALKKFTNYNKIILVAVIVMASFFIAPQTFASWQETVVGGIFFIFIGGLGLILTLVIKVLLMVASYQNFIGSQAVIQGWVIVRDLSNMFFVVILLVIAFATILHIESYNYKKWLPKLILMAVLINFSKTICGLLIDVAQIVMLTFVNSFKDVAAGNFVDMMGIKEIVTFQKDTGGNVFWTLMGAYMLGLIYMIIAVVVLTTMLMILVMRMVMIWIYVVLSPLAYLLSAFPGGAQYASKWWKDFISNLIVGPVLAFFIWLSFAALQTSESAADLAALGEGRINDGIVVSGENKTLNTGSGDMINEASKPSVFIKFIIGIGMLIGGLKIAQEVGGAAGSIAGKGMAKLNSMGAATSNFGKKWAGKIASGDNLLARKTAKASGFDFRPIAIASAIKSSYQSSKKKDDIEIKKKGAQNLKAGGIRSVIGGVGAGQGWGDAYWSLRGANRAFQEVSQIKPTQRKKRKANIENEESKLAEVDQQLAETFSSSQVVDIEGKVDVDKIKAQEMESRIKINEDLKYDLEVEIFGLENKIKSGVATYQDVADLDKKREKIFSLDGETSKMKSTKDVVERNIVENEEKISKAKSENKVLSDEDYAEVVKKRGVKQQDLLTAERRFARVLPPQALEARTDYRSQINTAKRQFDEIGEDGEKRMLFEDAVKRNDKVDQVAIMESLMQDVNFNELLKSRGYQQDGIGMVRFLNNEKNDFGVNNGMEFKGMDQQQKLMIQNDLSELAMRTGQWDYAKSVGVNSTGDRYSLIRKEKRQDGTEYWNDDDHVDAAASDALKSDPQKILNSLTRFSFGGEDMSGNFQISNLGRVLTKALDDLGAIVAQQSRIRPDIIGALNQPQTVKVLKGEVKISQGSLNALSSRKDPNIKAGAINYRKFLDAIGSLNRPEA